MTVTGVEPEQRSAVRAWLMGVLLIMLALVPAVGGYFVLFAWLPDNAERYRAYQTAEPCPGGTAEALTAHEDCLRTVTFTVERTRNEPQSRTDTYTAILTGTPFWNGKVRFGDPDPVLERLEPGDRITGTVWRGGVMSVGKDGLTQNTSDAPRDEPQMTVAIGLFLWLLAALGLVFGAVRIARPLRHEPFTWRPFGKILLIVTGVACVGVGLPDVWIGLPTWVVPATVLPTVAVTAWQLHQHYRPATARNT